MFFFDKDFRFKTHLGGESVFAILDTGTNVSFANIKNKKILAMANDKNIEDFNGEKLKFFNPQKFELAFKPSEEEWKVFLYDLSEAEVDLIIGMDALLGKKIFIDMVKKKFCILDSSDKDRI